MAVALFVCGDGMAAEFILSEMKFHDMRGNPPDGSKTWEEFSAKIPVYSMVNRELLYQNDSDPFHLVLEIARVGEVSVNRLEYDEELVGEIERQLPGKGGIRGHITDNQRSSTFPIEDVDWIGHLRLGDSLWAKGYIPPGETREAVRRTKARGGSIATSIYGPAKRIPMKGDKWRVKDLKLEQLDLAPAARASLQLGSNFAIVSQMTDKTGGSSMEDDSKIVSELLASRDEAKTLVAELQTQVKDKDAQITTLTTQAAQLSVIAEMANGQDVVTWVNGLVSELATVKREQRKAQRHDTAAAKVPDTLKPEARKRLVNLILVNVGEDVPDDKFETAVAEYMQSEDYQFFSKSVVSEMAGPAAVRSGSGKPSEIVIDDDFIARARQFAGI